MRTITKLKGLLIGLFTATLAFACVALTPKTAPAPVSAETTVTEVQATNVFTRDGSHTWIQLSEADYGNQVSLYNYKTTLDSLNTLSYIVMDGKTLTEAGKTFANLGTCYFDLYYKMNDTFTFPVCAKETVTIKAGCQFPSQGYLEGTSTVIYQVKEDRTYNYDAETDTFLREITVTETSTNVTSLYSVTNTHLSFGLSTQDYGTNASLSVATYKDKLDGLNTLSYIQVNEKTLKHNEIHSYRNYTEGCDPYINLWGRIPGSFTFTAGLGSGNGISMTKVFIKKGCQFPSLGYLQGTSNVVYVTTEDRMFTYDSTQTDAALAWTRAYEDIDISGGIELASIYSYADGFRFDFSTDDYIWELPSTGYWMGDHNRYLYEYITVNGKSIEWIANNVDDSTYTYTSGPASSNGGAWAIPVYVQATNYSNSTKNLFLIFVHQDYIDSLLETDGKITIGVSEGFYTLKGATRYIVNSAVEMDVAAQSASLTLKDSLQFNYKVQFPALAMMPTYTARFTFKGETVEYSTVNRDENGRLVYAFDKIAPQDMGEQLTISFEATYEGETFAWNTTTISVQEYCERLYETASGELKTLLVDVLNYGAAAQQYKGITENLVNANVDQQYATATAPTASDNVLAASQGDDVKFNAAVLTLEDKVTVTAKFTASNVDGLTATVQLGNNTAVAADIVALGNGVYGIVFADVAATQYDEAIVFTVSDTNGVVAKCRYSVNTYAQRTWDDATAGALAKALWAYGVSASAYAALV